MFKVKCPVPTCKGFETTSSSANIKNHIVNLAKAELLHMYIRSKDSTPLFVPHANWLKHNSIVIKREDYVIEV